MLNIKTIKNKNVSYPQKESALTLTLHIFTQKSNLRFEFKGKIKKESIIIIKHDNCY